MAAGLRLYQRLGHNQIMFTDLKIPAGRRPLTISESRIAAIAGTLFALMILIAVFEEFSAPRLSLAFIILFWAPLLVLHELGHALAARLLGWQVREIVIGFGQELWRWQSGATQLRIKLLPLEGYVVPAPPDASRLRLKSALIYAAGPGAELLLLAFLLATFGPDTVFGDALGARQVAVQSLAIAILLGAGFNLLPFRTDGGVSDGLGILSSPFMSEQSIQLRLLSFELRQMQELRNSGDTLRALELSTQCLQRFPGNLALQLAHAAALAAHRQTDAARAYVREHLNDGNLQAAPRRAWLQTQAQIELDADEPSWLVLDLALQKALADAPQAAGLRALKGAALVMRGRHDEGGALLADAWRSNDGSASDAEMLAYLTIAAQRRGDRAAAEHFRSSFIAINRCRWLAERLATLAPN
ncbi:MAG: site-2 protease family protein [Gammaproteobacteria bacterium]|nr:site-2 protease family protein [Gammaproteobacteria bacterium]MDH5302472.1 site-2 protease family protein [Gammaproteobacteria bacterium]MDH5321354.1 site-2 protease family protein [Gammaproteobacteria bacterium]